MPVRKVNIIFVLAVIAILYGSAETVSVLVRVQNPDGSLGSAIESASLTFQKEDGSSIAAEVSDSAERYILSFDTGRYIVNAESAYYVYTEEDPTYLFVEAGSKTANLFMEPR